MSKLDKVHALASWAVRKAELEILSDQELSDIAIEAKWMARLWTLDIDALLDSIPTISE